MVNSYYRRRQISNYRRYKSTVITKLIRRNRELYTENQFLLSIFSEAEEKMNTILNSVTELSKNYISNINAIKSIGIETVTSSNHIELVKSISSILKNLLKN